jgi:hypothetical protein
MFYSVAESQHSEQEAEESNLVLSSFCRQAQGLSLDQLLFPLQTLSVQVQLSGSKALIAESTPDSLYFTYQ